MRAATVVRRGAAYLERHGVDDPQKNALRLMSWVLGETPSSVALRDDLTPAQSRAYGRALCRRCAGTPLQHLTGEEGFRRLVLRVRPGVFVPRPETEILVEEALACIAEIESPSVIDVCTGTGAVALAIAQERPDARVQAADLSAEAVALARENAARLGLVVQIAEADLLDGVPASSFDLVTANPPYVPTERRADLPREVLADPPLAVFGGPPIYERLFAQAHVALRSGGHVAVEIEESAGGLVTSLAAAAGLEDVRVHPDLNGRDRVVTARRP